MIYGLGIANIGVATAKLICKHYQYQLESIRKATVEELSQIDGIGEVIAQGIVDYFQKEDNMTRLSHLLEEVEIEIEEVNEAEQTLTGKAFVITGSLEHFANRDELKELIESKGGKVTGSVTSKTVCLINNDITSNSSKNKKAKDIGVPIVTEEEFMIEYLNMSV